MHNVSFILIIGCVYLLYYLTMKSVTTIMISTVNRKTEFYFRQFLFRKTKIILGVNDFFYNYKEETGARGSRLYKLLLYNLKKESIIEITPGPSGWSENKIFDIIAVLAKYGC